MDKNNRINLLGLTESETEEWAKSLGLEAYRGRQIRKWIFTKLADSFDAMTDLSKELRSKIAKNASIHSIKHIKTETSIYGTKKYLFGLFDGYLIHNGLSPVIARASRRKISALDRG